jgi:hypothetical protein
MQPGGNAPHIAGRGAKCLVQKGISQHGANDAILVTHDRAFQQVADLPGIEDWASDL